MDCSQMLSMTARERRSSPARTGHYVWHVEGKPISVHLGPSAASAIRKLANSAARPGDARPVEVGGILMGVVQHCDDRYSLISVEAIEPVVCEYRRSESWSLSKLDKLGLYRKLRAAAGGDLHPVGFFRTHSRKGLYLDDYDLDLMRTFFTSAGSIALLVSGNPERQAGFFFWEEGDIRRSEPYATFSLSDIPEPEQVSRPQAVPRARPSFDWRWAMVPLAVGLVLIVPSYFPDSIANERQSAPIEREAPPAPAEILVPAPAVNTPVSLPRAVPDIGSRARTVQPAIKPKPKERLVATVRPEKPNVVKRALSHVPGFGKLRGEAQNFIEARPLFRVTPAGRQVSATAVKVRIDETGAVRSAWLSGNAVDSAAASAALNAAKRWRFAPARRNGKPVESSLVIQFAPSQRT